MDLFPKQVGDRYPKPGYLGDQRGSNSHRPGHIRSCRTTTPWPPYFVRADGAAPSPASFKGSPPRWRRPIGSGSWNRTRFGGFRDHLGSKPSRSKRGDGAQGAPALLSVAEPLGPTIRDRCRSCRGRLVAGARTLTSQFVRPSRIGLASPGYQPSALPLSYERMVGVTGIEPASSPPRTECLGR